MKNPIVIGVGEFLWDMLPSGKKAGGAPANFAYHASQNGAEGWAVSAIGKEALGRELMEVARAHGINLAIAEVDHPTGTVNVTLRDGQPDYEICEGVAWDFIPATSQMLALARESSAISFGTLAQRSEVSRKTTRTLLEAAPESALKIYDINLRQHFYSAELIDESLRLANILKINDDELEVVKPLLGLSGMGVDETCHSILSRYGLKMLVLTGGDKFSSIYYGNDDKSYIVTPKVDVVDTVGAGDAFSGALIGALLSGMSVKDAHRVAVDTAAYVCTCSGAWTPARK